MSGSALQKIEQAALNNALWIRGLCCLYECPSQINEKVFFSSQTTPPFTPNLVTLKDAKEDPLYYRKARELLKLGTLGSFAIKDSFRTLDLQPLGFQILFDSQWIYKEATGSNLTDLGGIEWEDIKTASVLAEWETSRGEWSDPKDFFPPRLLQNQNILVIAARRNREIVAGCIASVAAGCVGISHVFLPSKDTQLYRRSFVSKLHATFPKLPLVGYERDEDLIGMHDVGFETIGWLRVWYHEPR